MAAPQSYAAVARSAVSETEGHELMGRTYGIKMYMQSNLPFKAFLDALGETVGKKAIVSGAVVSGKVVVLLKTEQAVALALERGVTAGGNFAAMDPWGGSILPVILSNVPTFVPDALLIPHVRKLGEVRSGLTKLLYRFDDPEMQHIYTFKRRVYIQLAQGTDTEGSFEVEVDDFSYRVFWNAGQVRCHACKKVGHFRRNCPRTRAASSTTMARESTTGPSGAAGFTTVAREGFTPLPPTPIPPPPPCPVPVAVDAGEVRGVDGKVWEHQRGRSQEKEETSPGGSPRR